MTSPSRIASAAPNRRGASTRWLRGGQSCQPADAVDDISQVAPYLGQLEALPKEPNRAVQVAQVGTDGAESDEDARQNQAHLMVVSDLERLLQPRHGQRYDLAARDCRTGLSEGRDADWCLEASSRTSLLWLLQWPPPVGTRWFPSRWWLRLTCRRESALRQSRDRCRDAPPREGESVNRFSFVLPGVFVWKFPRV